MVRSRWFRRGLRSLELAGSALVLGLVVVLCATGVGGLPALGQVLNPGTGVWRLSPEATAAESGTRSLPGLRQPATVTFENNGLPHIKAGEDSDLWQVVGYLHGQFRLTQLDLIRRRGAGQLAEVLGPSALNSDTMELDLGLRRAAERDWAQLPDGEVRTALTAYADGVNAAIDELSAVHRLPAAFTLLGYRPARWTPVDSLVVQRVQSQGLSFTDAAVTYSYLAGALPPADFHAFFPDVPANPQQPYDSGPYVTAGLAPLPKRADPATGPAGPGVSPTPSQAPTRQTAEGLNPDLRQLKERLAALPAGAVHQFGASNAWAVSGQRTASGKPLLAADPHLDFSLPAIWYQVEGTSPSYHFHGVTIPGAPMPLMGRTDAISWGITAAQRPTTLFYLEQTSQDRPDQYFWEGSWRAMEKIDYSIEVKGQAAVRHTLKLTAHGPVLQVQGKTVSVWWAGALPSQNFQSLLGLLRAKEPTAFRESMRGWSAPALNIVYADQSGNIGAFNVGAAPQVPRHDISLPLPGDGSADVAGSIPYEALPHVANPESGVVASANQREVAASYPYQYSSSYNFADQGFRAAEIHRRLTGATGLTAADFQRLQTDERDQLAAQLVSALLPALDGQPLSPTEQRVVAALGGWDGEMSLRSIAPTFAEAFANHLAYTVFRPWQSHFTTQFDPRGALNQKPFERAATTEPLLASILAWLQHEPTSRYLSAPQGPARDATALLRQVFHETVAHLEGTLGQDLDGWEYGKRHTVQFQSLLQSPPLDRGPLARGGGTRTINAAGGGIRKGGVPDRNTTTAGASWRFVMDWGSGKGASVYPGGQSEHPLSPWYDNGIPLWMAGRLWPMRYGDDTAGTTSSAEWRLTR